jgi:hypothetical protein
VKPASLSQRPHRRKNGIGTVGAFDFRPHVLG